MELRFVLMSYLGCVGMSPLSCNLDWWRAVAYQGWNGNETVREPTAGGKQNKKKHGTYIAGRFKDQLSGACLSHYSYSYSYTYYYTK